MKITEAQARRIAREFRRALDERPAVPRGVRNAAGKLRTLMLVHGGNAGMTADKRLV